MKGTDHPVERPLQHCHCLTNENFATIRLGRNRRILTNRKHWCPMDVEWAVDGLTKIIYCRRDPKQFTAKDHTKISGYLIDESTPRTTLFKGIAVGDKVASGKVAILFSLDKRVTEGHVFKPGDVLVTDMTDPDWEPIMKQASAIITNKGGRTCHAAIVARELGVPAIVGCGKQQNW